MQEFARLIGYSFKNGDLLGEAFTHPSLSRAGRGRGEISKNYERLEFLGDVVLSLVISHFLFAKYKDENEGQLAKRRSYLVGHKVLSEIAARIDLGKYMKLSGGEENIGGRGNPANLENCLEALIGALYLDGGLETARAFIDKFWADDIAGATDMPSNPKSELQEILQKMGKPVPEYHIVATHGPAHKPEFEIEVRAEGIAPERASGASRKLAEIMAAENMLKKLQNNG